MPGLPQVFGDLDALALQQANQTLEVMNIRKRLAAMDKDRLDGFLRALLSIETQILKEAAWHGRHGARQVSSCAIEPLARIVRRRGLSTHKRPFLP